MVTGYKKYTQYTILCGLFFSFTVRTEDNTSLFPYTNEFDNYLVHGLSEVYENIMKCEISNFVPVRI